VSKILAALVLVALFAAVAHAAVPSTALSYFVPVAGPLDRPCEGSIGNCGGLVGGAIRNFRSCPDNDGGSMLPNNARIMVVVKMSDGRPLVGIAAQDVCLLFNGGTPAQGFNGIGDDSIVANSQYNPGCPDVRCISADQATGLDGTTYITLTGGTYVNGNAVRDPSRKWGNWAGDIPIYVQGFKLQGRLTSDAPPGSYTAHIRSLDTQGNTTLMQGMGEIVNSADVNAVQSILPPSGSRIDDAECYRYDFDNSGYVNSVDLNLIRAHIANGSHTCSFPLAP